MRRCFQLASKALGQVAPNPLVGCVIVKNDSIIGEGFHRLFGKNHAEINAIESVMNQEMLRGADLYVNLEPCTHYGKTPPCADRIIEKGISRVFISGSDPSEKVLGKGIEKLKKAGIHVETGILSDLEFEINKRFRTYYERKRPYIILKWAESADGFMDTDRSNGQKGQFRISGETSRRLLHKWRSEEQAILIGCNTAVNDDPELNVRLVEGKNPLRLVIDLYHKMPADLKLLNDGGPVVIYSDADRKQDQIIQVKTDKKDVLPFIMRDLYGREIQSVLVEGGKITLDEFIRNNLWDEVRIFKSKIILGSGLPAPVLELEAESVEKIGSDYLKIYRNRI